MVGVTRIADQDPAQIVTAGLEPELFDCRDAFSKTLEEMAAKNPKVCAVVNDSVSSTKLKNFRSRFPERFVNVGIAEQNMVGVGCGLANGGIQPYVAGASCFLTARAMEQIKVDLGYSNSNVKLCGMSSGMAYGELGPTHHSVEDVAWTRIIPNLAVVVPADPIETRAAMLYSEQHVGPMFLRISRMPVRRLLDENYMGWDVYHHNDPEIDTCLIPQQISDVVETFEVPSHNVFPCTANPSAPQKPMATQRVLADGDAHCFGQCANRAIRTRKRRVSRTRQQPRSPRV